MCHAHPRYHPCNHTSLAWYFCTTASCNLQDGTSTPCPDSRMGLDQSVKMDCPLKYCKFKQKGPGWRCCECGQGPNLKGWCTMPRHCERWDSSGRKVEFTTTCDHGCCENCTSTNPASSSSSRSGGKKRSHGSASTSSSSKSHSRKRNLVEQKGREYEGDVPNQYLDNGYLNVEYASRPEMAAYSRSSKTTKKSHHAKTR